MVPGDLSKGAPLTTAKRQPSLLNERGLPFQETSTAKFLSSYNMVRELLGGTCYQKSKGLFSFFRL